jgi:hypothetical protein
MEKRLQCAQLLLDDGAVLNIDRPAEMKALELLIVNASTELRSLRSILLLCSAANH